MLRTTLKENGIILRHSTSRLVAFMSSSSRVKTTYTENKTASISLQRLTPQRRSPVRGIIAPYVNRATLFLSNHLPIGLQKKLIYVFYFEEAPQPIIEKMGELEVKIQKSKSLKKIDELTLQKIDMVRSNIEEHAYRRVEMFFYLLISVWNKQVKVTKEGGADFQHGAGSAKYGTAACHSNPFTNLKFTRLNGPTALLSMFRKEISLEGTHFNDSLNATMELPEVVNQFDKHFEGIYGASKYMNAGIEILNKCARGEINPVDGLSEFMQVMDSFFERFKGKHIDKKSEINLPESMAEIWKIQRKGTLSMCADNSTKPGLDFLAMVLGMTKAQVLFARVCPRLFNQHFRRIQGEIFGANVGGGNKLNS